MVDLTLKFHLFLSHIGLLDNIVKKREKVVLKKEIERLLSVFLLIFQLRQLRKKLQETFKCHIAVLFVLFDE